MVRLRLLGAFFSLGRDPLGAELAPRFALSGGRLRAERRVVLAEAELPLTFALFFCLFAFWFLAFFCLLSRLFFASAALASRASRRG
jgi:hypothetical protein